MSLFPRPPLPSFQVTLLPEAPQTPSGKAAGTGSASTRLSANPPASPSPPASSPTQTQARDVTIAKDMLQAVFRIAADCTVPQRRFSGYSPELVLRSVRAMVDDGLTMQLVGALQAAARQYAQDCVAALTAQLPPTPAQPPTADELGDDADEEVAAAHARASLASVQLLARLVTCWERLQQGLTELSCVWVYADQWCQARAGTGVPRSLAAAATQEMCEVLCRHRQVGAAALDGYLAVLRAELAEETDTLLAAARSAGAATTSMTTAASPPPRGAQETGTPASLAALTHPPSLAALDAPLRRRLLRLFTELTRATQLFTSVVEPAVAQAVRRHYERVANALWADDVSARVFFRFCEGALKHVGPMAAAVFHPSTTPLLEEALQAVLLSAVGGEVLKRDFVRLMERQAYATLRLGWRLLSATAHVRSSPVVTTLFHEYVINCGQHIVEELVPSSTKATAAAAHVLPRDRPFLAVRHMLGLLEQGTQTIAHCFAECEKDFKVTLHEDLQTILEAYPNAFSEQLAAYQDAIMKEVEVRHVPVSATAAAAAAAAAAPAASDKLGSVTVTPATANEEEGERDAATQASEAAPLRRARSETTCAPPVYSVSLSQASAPATAASEAGAVDEEGEGKEGGDELPVGTAALRLAAPLPADVVEATSVLRRIAVIYSYHPKKELFEAAYWRDFARRCLHAHRKLNTTAESCFIGYLRDICGLSFTSKFEGMLTDLTASAELTSEYKTWAAEQQPHPSAQAEESSASASREPEVHLFVLAQSYWPKYASLPPNFYVPPPLHAVTQAVEKFYAARFANRHLTWQHPLSHATLLARLTPQSTPLTMTGTYTQCVLLMRLDALHDRGVTTVTAKALCDALGLDLASAEVLWSLQGLCHPRFRLVLREGSADAASAAPADGPEPSPQRPSAELENEEEETTPTTAKSATPAAASTAAAAAAALTLAPTDRLRLNLDFTSATSKVRIPLQTRIRGAGTAAAVDGTSRSSRTAENGAHLIEVALVSCLKAQRTMSHADVASAVAARLPFAVTTAALKKAVDKMIERGFIVRGKDGTYIYSA